MRHGKLVFKVKEEFYKGPKMPVADAVELMKESSIVNMVGANIVNKAIEEGLVHPEAVLKICGVPHGSRKKGNSFFMFFREKTFFSQTSFKFFKFKL